jgi:NhaP-type Na+/H+ or K+/H+ antiporter
VLGGITAALIFDQFTWALAGYVAASLAPTDAALSAQVINDRRVPLRLRLGLNVESGLNDGIATPVVTLMLALAAFQLGLVAERQTAAAGAALRELGLGVLGGLVLGVLGAVLITQASRRGWVVPGGRRLATLGLAVAAYTAAVAIGGNGFISAFVAGIAFGGVLNKDAVKVEDVVQLPELGGELLALMVWFAFGAALIPIGLEHLNASVIAYAVLSLTVIRMVPVAASMIRSGLSPTSVLFLAWFGPRGLASVIFALLAVEQLGDQASEAVAAISITILLSVILHGITAGPVGRRYVHTDEARAEKAAGPPARNSGFLPRRPSTRS